MIIPPRYRDAAFSEMKIHEIPDSCLLVGPVGCGKTHLAWCKVKQLLQDDNIVFNRERSYIGGRYTNKNLYFVTMPKLLMEIRATYDGKSDKSDADIIEIYSTCDYLIIDDLGAEKLTDFARGSLYQIIDHRYNYMKDTIITTNLEPHEIAQRFDDRIASRIISMCQIIRLENKDWRIENKK